MIVNGCNNSSREVISGVPLGTVLGPLLFLCCINDLPSHVKSSVKLNADDVIFYRVIGCDADHEILALTQLLYYKLLYTVCICA